MSEATLAAKSSTVRRLTAIGVIAAGGIGLLSLPAQGLSPPSGVCGTTDVTTPAALCGTVRSKKTKAGLAGVTVHVRSLSNSSDLMTDASGRFRRAFAGPRQYTVSFEKQGAKCRVVGEDTVFVEIGPDGDRVVNGTCKVKKP